MDNIQVTHNNDNHHYRIAMDIAKEGSSLWDLTPYVKGRVGDNRFGLQVTWTCQGQLMNIEGMKPYIEGNVGQYSVDDKNNLQLDPNSGVVRYVGDPADCQAGGQATYYFPEQMFPKEGIFKGYIGLLDDRDDSKNPHISGVTVWFKVLPGIAEMGHACDYYISDLEKAEEIFKAKLRQHEADFQNETNKVISDARNTYTSEVSNAHDALVALQAQIAANRDEQETLSQHLAGTEQQIEIHDIVTIPKHEADIDNISAAINKRLAQLHNGPTGIENAELLKSNYPNGTDGTFLALDTNHIWIWLNNQWRDAGDYQASGLSQQAQEAIENTRSVVLGNELISNGSFATGKSDPAIPLTGDTHLGVHQWSDRNWLNITSDGNSPWKGVQWNFNDSDKTYFNNPVQIDFDISSLENKQLQLHFVYYDSKGNRLHDDLIDNLKLLAGQYIHYRNVFYLNQNQRDCNYVGFQIVQPSNDKIQKIIITGASAKEVYPKNESNKNLINLDNVRANIPEITALTTNKINNQRWIKIDSAGGKQWAGAIWDFDSVQDLPYYPLQLSFDIRGGGDSKPHDFAVVIKGYNDSNDLLLDLNLPQVKVDQNKLFKYNQYVILPFAEALQCTWYQLDILSLDKDQIDGVLITNVSLKQQLPHKNDDGNLIDFSQFQANMPNITSLVADNTNNQKWIGISSKGGDQWAGIAWNFDPVQDLPYYPLQLSFDIRGDNQQREFNVVLKGWDNSKKELVNVKLPSVLIGINELVHYDQSLILTQTEALQCTHFQLSITTESTDPIQYVLVSNIKLCIKPHNNNNNLISLVDAQNNQPLVDTISIETVNQKDWIHVHGSGSDTWGGVKWNISNEDLTRLPVHLKFKGYSPYESVSMLLDIKGWDKDNKLVFEQSPGTFTFTENISSFDEIIKLPENTEKCSNIAFSISCPDRIAFDIMINSLELYTVIDSDFIKWQYKQFHLPVVSLQGDLTGISKDTSKKVTWKYYDDQQVLNGLGEVKWQGNSSLSFAKKSYRLKTLDADYKEKDKVKFKSSWSKNSKFNLKAYYTDGLLSRDPVNAQIGSAILASQNNLPDDIVKEDNFGFISGFPVVLFINQEYAGLYSLNTARPDFEYTKYAIMGNQWNDISQFKSTNPQAKLDGSDFESLNPDDAPNDDERKAVNDLIKFVSTSSDDEFKSHLEEHVSIDSAIDYLILNNIIGNPDAFAKNQILLTWDGKKWYFSAYDLDDSFQGSWDGTVIDKPTIIVGENHKLFERLCNLFADKIKQRYTDLRSWLTPDWILAKYRSRVDKIGVKNYQKEFAKWNNPAKDTEDFNQLRAAVYAQISLLDKFWLVSNADKINDLKNQIDQLKNINNPKPAEPQSGTTPANTEPAKQETPKPTTPQTQPASGTEPKVQPSGTKPANTEPAKQETGETSSKPTEPQAQPTEQNKDSDKQ